MAEEDDVEEVGVGGVLEEEPQTVWYLAKNTLIDQEKTNLKLLFTKCTSVGHICKNTVIQTLSFVMHC